MKKIVTSITIMLGLVSSIYPLRESSYPFVCGDTFRSFADFIYDETARDLDPRLVKSGNIIFVKTDYLPDFFSNIHSRIQYPYILITHNSDYAPLSLTTQHVTQKKLLYEPYLNDNKIIVWFAQNAEIVHSKLIPIPIGIGNEYTFHGKKAFFDQAIGRIPTLQDRNNFQAYINFTVGNHAPWREPILRYFRSCPFAYITGSKPTALYLEEMKKFTFVISPPGNGLDCHRTWEALLMGCIPIVQHSTIDAVFDGLPVILVDDWTQVTEAFLKEEYQKIITQTYDRNNLFADYWLKRIRAYQCR